MAIMPNSTIHNNWNQVADRVLAGDTLTSDEGLSVLRSTDDSLLDLLAAVYRVRRHWHGNRVHLNFLVNAKSGLCGEDCGYCSQSRFSQSDIPRYRLLSAEQLIEGAATAAGRQATTYCMVTSGRSPSREELDVVASAARTIKQSFDLRLCVSTGLLTAEQAAELKSAGVDRINHNLNTSQRYYPAICTTHDYTDRLRTLEIVRQAGLEICSGGIVGMGEDDEDVVELALRVGQIRAEAVPVNFFLPIPGTRLTPSARLTPRYCLKVLALFRLACPASELRIAAGREVYLGSMQAMGLYAASSIFVGDYLTTKGQPAEADYRMIEEMGFEPVLDAAAGASTLGE